jgi:hypothetical protein
MAKLKRFSFSSKSKSSQGDASDAAAAAAGGNVGGGGGGGVMAASAARSHVTSSSWLGGGPPLVVDDHISSDAAAAAAADPETVTYDGEETISQWNAEEEPKGMYVAPDELDDLRRGAVEGSEGSEAAGCSDGSAHGKVVIRGCVGDVCVTVVDDGEEDGVGKGCSAEVKEFRVWRSGHGV